MDKLDLIYNTVKENSKDIKNILQRLTRVEVKSAIYGGVLGTIGGCLISLLLKGVLS